MGNCCAVEGAIDHWIYVQTGDRHPTTMEASIKLVLYDDKGRKSPEIELCCTFNDGFERGQTDTFQGPPLAYLNNITTIEMWRSDGDQGFADWYCDVIMVNDARMDKSFYFPIQRWVKGDFHYMIPANDTSLPQKDPYPEQRRAELGERRTTYTYAQLAPDLPVQVYKLPEDEQFSDEYKWDIESQKAELQIKSMMSQFTQGYWESFEELDRLFYQSPLLPQPRGRNWYSNDIWFGAQRLVGCNPTMIKLCTGLPENMGVTAEMLRGFFEGWSVKQIIDAKRLFVCDYKILDNLPTTGDRPMVAPVGLFFLNGDKQLIPIAIQLHQNIAPDNPVYLCNDAPFTWLLAKMWLNLADSMVHQGLSHLGFTHLIMEGICVCTHRTLSRNHPIFKLLAAHFTFLLAINSRGLQYLLRRDGWIDRTTQMGREGLFELLRRGVEDWRIDVQGNLPKELETRGVLDPKVLPNYAYREDAMPLFKAIEEYVGKIVKHYYPHPDVMKADSELQDWSRELATPKERGGVGIQGMPKGGNLQYASDLISICTSIIFTCTAQHAACNFPQYDEYAFVPNYPAMLNGLPPIDKIPRSEEDLVSILPDKATTLETMLVTKLLSQRGEKTLGQWEFQFQYDPPARSAEEEFRKELERISQDVKAKNTRRDPIYQYPYLDPDNIPNSIVI